MEIESCEHRKGYSSTVNCYGEYSAQVLNRNNLNTYVQNIQSM